MPYKLRKAPKRELYWVIAEDGTKKSKEPIPLARAKAQMRALYASMKGGMLTAEQTARQLQILRAYQQAQAEAEAAAQVAPARATTRPVTRPPVQAANPLRSSYAPDASAIIPLAGIANATCSALGSCFGMGKRGGGFQFRKEEGKYVIFDDESGQIIKRLNTLGETLQLVRKYTKEGLPKIQKVYEPMEGEEEEVNEGAEVSSGGDQQYRTQLNALLSALAPGGVIRQQSLFENLRSFLSQSNPGHAFLIRLFPYLMNVRSDAPLSKLADVIGKLVPDLSYYMKTPINKQKAYIEFMSGAGLRGGNRQQINFLISRVEQMERLIAAKQRKGEDTTDLEDQRLNALYIIQELENAIVYDDPQQEAQQDEESEDPSGTGRRKSRKCKKCGLTR